MNTLPLQTSSGEKVTPKIPETWNSVVKVIRHFQVIDKKPVLLTISGLGFSSIVIDFTTNLFYSEGSILELPRKPSDLRLLTKAIDTSKPIQPSAPWQAIDALLWELGSLAFELTPAFWLVTNDGYMLKSWPKLSQIRHTVDELRLISMLANSLLSIEQLAHTTDTTLELSAKTISKLSLLGILKNAPVPPSKLIAKVAVPVLVEQKPAASTNVEVPSLSSDESPVQIEKEPALLDSSMTQFDDVSVIEEEAPIEQPLSVEPLEEMPEESIPEAELERVAQLYPSFDPNAPARVTLRAPIAINPALVMVESFSSLLESKNEPEIEKPETTEKGGFLGRLRGKKNRGDK